MIEWNWINSNNKHVFISYVECLRRTTILILSTSQMSHLHLLTEANDAQLSNASKVSYISQAVDAFAEWRQGIVTFLK